MIEWLKRKLSKRSFNVDRWEHYKMMVDRDFRNIDSTGIIHKEIKRIEENKEGSTDEAISTIESAVEKVYKEHDDFRGSLQELEFLLQEFVSIVRNKHYDYRNIDWLIERYDKIKVELSIKCEDEFVAGYVKIESKRPIQEGGLR